MRKEIVTVAIFASIITGCSNTKLTPNQEVAAAAKALKLAQEKANKQVASKTALKLPEPKKVESNKMYVDYINKIRQKGAKCAVPAPALTQNGYLDKAAFTHANDMATNDKLTHRGSGKATDPAKPMPGVGSQFFERVVFLGYPANVSDLVGEDITFVSNKIVKSSNKAKSFNRAIASFLKEPTHCKILMEPRFKDIGIGYSVTPKGTYWVIDFGETAK